MDESLMPLEYHLDRIESSLARVRALIVKKAPNALLENERKIMLKYVDLMENSVKARPEPNEE